MKTTSGLRRDRSPGAALEGGHIKLSVAEDADNTFNILMNYDRRSTAVGDHKEWLSIPIKDIKQATESHPFRLPRPEPGRDSLWQVRGSGYPRPSHRPTRDIRLPKASMSREDQRAGHDAAGENGGDQREIRFNRHAVMHRTARRSRISILLPDMDDTTPCLTGLTARSSRRTIFSRATSSHARSPC